MGSERHAAYVFGVLNDRTRLDILRTVADTQHAGKETGEAQLPFSELYEPVAVENTLKLSYYLRELTGAFLRKHEEEYSFTIHSASSRSGLFIV